MSDLKSILNSYTVRVLPLAAEDGGGYKAVYEEFGLGTKGYGDTPARAVTDLEEVALDVLGDIPLSEFPTPRREAPWTDYGGRVTLRVPKILHGQLDRLAHEQGVSLNQLMAHALQSAATAMLAGREFGICAEPSVEVSLEPGESRLAS